MQQSTTTPTNKLEPLAVPAEAYLAWVRTTMEAQDSALDRLMEPLRGLDMEVAVSEQWLEDLSEVAHAFIEPEPEHVAVAMNMSLRA